MDVDLKIHHIGYLVKNIDKAIEKFNQLGFKRISETTCDEIRHIHICFMEKDGYVIELVSPYDSNSVVSKLMKQYKNSPYHICYLTNKFEETCTALQTVGYVMLDNPLPAPALEGKRVVFLISHISGMIELLEQ